MPLDFDAVERQLSVEDPVSVLLRGHLWVEEGLTDLIRATLEFPDEWQELERLSFPSKVSLARAQGVIYWTAGLLALNRARNHLAHNPRFEIDRKVALELAGSFEPDFRQYEAEDRPRAPETADTDTPAAIIRAVLVELIGYIAVSMAETLTTKTHVLQEQSLRLEQLIDDRGK